MDNLHSGQLSSLSSIDRTHNDLAFPPWEWAPSRLGSSPSHCGDLLDPPLVLEYVTQPAPDFHSLTREISVFGLEPECKVLSFQRTPPPGNFLSHLSLPALDPIHLDSSFHQDGLQSGFERSCMNKPPQSHPFEDEEVLSPLEWTTGPKNLLASPFSDDSDSDDGLAPSPFSSPESSSKSETDEETRGYLFSPPTTSGRSHLGNHLPTLELYHDRTNDDGLLSYSTSVPDARIPHSASSPSSSYGSDEVLQSPSLLPAPLPIFNSLYYFDDSPSALLGSPRCRAVELPEDEIDSKESRFGLGLHSTGPSYALGDFHSGDEAPPRQGFLQRTTWLSLPGADTDDDLIPADLGSKTYIPDPSITIPTTPPSRSLLIWDPTTRSGLPAGLPSFDGTGHTGHRFDVDAFPIRRPHSPEEDFDVDPALLARLAEKDAEQGVEVQKLCDLKQRTTIAAVAAWKGREGAQLDVERVREKWREVTALLRLKLASDEEASKTAGVIHDERGCVSSAGAEDGKLLPSSAPSVGASSLSSSTTPSVSSVSTTPEALTDSLSSTSDSSSSTSPQIRHRASKPKITSMAQLVANMVFHRQQDALRRSPIRNRTWSPLSSVTHTNASGKTRSLTQTSPTSPLRQMILPEDLDSDSDADECVLDSPLQLSPLSLSLCRSPESFYAQLEATTSVPLSS